MTRYLIGQKPVTLVHVPKDGSQVTQSVTHYIHLQGQQMYLHCLKESFDCPSSEKGMKKFFDFFEQVDSNLRTDSFTDLINSNILHSKTNINTKDTEEIKQYSLPITETDSQQVNCNSNLIKNTMWFPYYLNTTVLCQQQVSQELNRMLNTLYNYFISVSDKITI